MDPLFWVRKLLWLNFCFHFCFHSDEFTFHGQQNSIRDHIAVVTRSPSRGRNVAVYVFDIKQPSLPTPFFKCSSSVCFCLYGPFNWISFDKVSRQLSTFSLCSFGLISALLLLWTIYLFMLHESLPQPWYNPLWLTGLEAPTNQPTNKPTNQPNKPSLPILIQYLLWQWDCGLSLLLPLAPYRLGIWVFLSQNRYRTLNWRPKYVLCSLTQ